MDSDKWTDTELERLEKRIAEQYEQAQKELGEKAQKYFLQFEDRFKREELAMLTTSLTKDEVETKWVDLYGSNAGFERWYKGADHAYGQTKTEAENKFKLWEMAQLGRGQHWYDMRDQMAQRLTETNKIAEGYINGKLPEIYIANNNGMAEIAKASAMSQGATGVRFDLVDEYTVRNLMMESSSVRPYKPVNISIDESTKWSKNKLQNALLQGILQGDSITDIADRFQSVTNMNRTAAIRNARTACTYAQNKGKQDRLMDLKKQGCVVTKKWKATADERTRPEHWEAHLQEVDVDQPFEVGGELLMEPGDPSASGWNRYNCRCTMAKGKIQFKSILSEEEQKKANIRIVGNESASSIKRNNTVNNTPQRILGKYKTQSEAINGFVNDIGFKGYGEELYNLDKKLLIDSANQLLFLENKFNVIHRSKGFVNVGTYDTKESGTFATGFVRRNPLNALYQNLYYTMDGYKDYKTLVAGVEACIKSKDKMPASKDKYSVYETTHEYGHMLNNIFIYNDIEKLKQSGNIKISDLMSEKWHNYTSYDLTLQYLTEIEEIAKKNNPKFSLDDNISNFATNGYEAFAEVFANSQLGEPNELGNAMNIWLEQKGY